MDRQDLSVNYQSRSNTSNNTGTGRGALTTGGDDFLGPPSLRSQHNVQNQKITYLEKENESL